MEIDHWIPNQRNYGGTVSSELSNQLVGYGIMAGIIFNSEIKGFYCLQLV